MKELLHRDGTPMRKYSSPLINELNEERMTKELFESLDRISDKMFDIDVKITLINEKLEELIAALHAYDDDQLEWPEPNDALKEAAAQYNEKVAPCRGHDAASWDEERMNIIGQNGNEGIHYTDVDENEFNDYGERVNNNTQTKHTGETKKRNKRKYYKPKQ
jgi:hypothetical protein